MVTGVETAGLVLAAFPLVVDGLSHYADGIQTIQYWRRYRRELRDYARKLKSQGVRYQNTLELLFDGIVESEEELAALLKDPAGSLWQGTEYEEGLRSRLDHSYGHFLDVLKNMIETLDAMKARLGIDPSGNITWDQHFSVKREMKRLDIVLFRGTYIDMLNTIDVANKDLQEFARENKHLEPVRQKRRSRRPHAIFNLIKTQARSLYSLFVTGTAWSCRCKEHHTASLRLEARPGTAGVLGPDGLPILSYRALLSKRIESAQSVHGRGADLPYDWREVEVQPYAIESEAVNDSQRPDPPVTSIKPNKPSPTTGKSLKSIKKRVQIVEPPCDPKPRSQRYDAGEPQDLSPTLVTDVCATVYQCELTGCSMGFFTHTETGSKHRYHLYLPEDARRDSDLRKEPLESLLGSTRRRHETLILSRRDRLYTAVTLASSVLQLGSTLWLNRRWSSSDIIFHSKEGSTSLRSNPLINHPYLCWDLFKPGERAIKISFPERQHIHNETLLALGLTLVELSFGKTLTEMQEPGDATEDVFSTKLNAARRLIDRVYDESGCKYGDVVRICLDCQYHFRDLRSDVDRFQEAIFDNIVTPLALDLSAFGATMPGK